MEVLQKKKHRTWGKVAVAVLIWKGIRSAHFHNTNFRAYDLIYSSSSITLQPSRSISICTFAEESGDIYLYIFSMFEDVVQLFFYQVEERPRTRGWQLALATCNNLILLIRALGSAECLQQLLPWLTVCRRQESDLQIQSENILNFIKCHNSSI